MKATPVTKRARRTVRALVLACAAVVAGACATARQASWERSARVLVYNMHAGKDAAGVDNLTRIASLVDSVSADIVLLQEVDRNTTRSGRVDQPAMLARL